MQEGVYVLYCGTGHRPITDVVIGTIHESTTFVLLNEPFVKLFLKYLCLKPLISSAPSLDQRSFSLQ